MTVPHLLHEPYLSLDWLPPLWFQQSCFIIYLESHLFIRGFMETDSHHCIGSLTDLLTDYEVLERWFMWENIFLWLLLVVVVVTGTIGVLLLSFLLLNLWLGVSLSMLLYLLLKLILLMILLVVISSTSWEQLLSLGLTFGSEFISWFIRLDPLMSRCCFPSSVTVPSVRSVIIIT